MSKAQRGTSKPIVKSTLRFFNTTLSDLNDKRLQLNRGKNLAKYLSPPQKEKKALAPLENTLGIMSFSFYMLRFLNNLGLLIRLHLEASSHNTNVHKELYYCLFNDSLWCAVNLIQFFWLSSKNSISAGLQGMQLETVAQFIDILVMIIRYQEDREDYNLKYNKATVAEQARLDIEWKQKEIQTLRALLTGASITIVFGLSAFSLMAVPLSPILSSITLISGLLRILFNIEKDRQLIHQLKLKKTPFHNIMKEESTMKCARWKDLNNIILNSLFLPMGLFLTLTTPFSLTILVYVTMLLIHYLTNNLIDKMHSSCEASITKMTNCH